MQVIEAIIRERQLDKVRDALAKIHIVEYTTSSVVADLPERSRLSHTIDPMPLIKLEITCDDELVKKIVGAIRFAAVEGIGKRMAAVPLDGHGTISARSTHESYDPTERTRPLTPFRAHANDTKGPLS